ncbi:MAG: elongation factor Ts [Verrucomicrobiae bacterium]|nr:elongation factor Ts [Verrucomicrobiae bacterium]MCP5539051.1 elongation factor Ts [Akkermansiaceae bacterium]MCP5551208.1 elongation factor Ts [Akkermansiaceae bacterium]
MAEITVELIKTLREKTNAGMMDCKAALTEAGGDLAEAETILRKKGIADADKKATRAAKEGAVASLIDPGARTGVLIEVNCETDFVAKNENFQEFVDGLLQHALEAPAVDSVDAVLAQKYAGDEARTVEEVVKAKVGQLGENLVFQRYTHYAVEGNGVIASYIHMQGKVGVLIEVNCGKAETAANETFRELVKDITLHIAAAHPVCVARDEVPAEKVEAEKDIYRAQMAGKPDNIIEKILAGKLDKFYSTIALLEQGFVKDPDQTIGALLEAKGKEIGDTLSVRRFTRYALGEDADS